MSFLGTEKLKQLILNENVIAPHDLQKVDCGAYQLSLGDEVFSTDSTSRKKQVLTQPKEQITINPGQFALLLTLETVRIPKNKIAFISIKASIKLKGLVNVSGFHVDPGFKGKLVFSVYNAGSSPVSLIRGEECFLIWFSDLQLLEGEDSGYDKGSHEHKNQDSIPVKYIDALIAGELASPNVLLKKIDANKTAVDNEILLVKKDQTLDSYLIKTALGIVIALILKFSFDWYTYEKGYNTGEKSKERQIKEDSIINSKLYEKKRLIIEIDSLNKLKNEAKSK